MKTIEPSPIATEQAEYRYSQLTPEQRDAAVRLAAADGRPNCIGLKFRLDESGVVTGFRDSMPHMPHGDHPATE